MQGAAQEPQLSAARVAPGAGAMLKRAREQTGLSLTEVAARTRLEPRVLEALESEDYSQLAASAFVKGYIRSVARELGIDAAPVLAQFSQQVHLDDPALADFSTRSPVQVTSASMPMRIASGAIALVVVVLIAIWWQRNYHANPAPDVLLDEFADPTAPRPDPGTPLPYSFTIVEHSTELLGPVNSWRHQTDGSTPPAIPTLSTAAEPAADDAAATTVAEASAPAMDTAPVAAGGPAPSGELQLEGRGESWVEISDVAGKRLFFGMLKPGQRIGVSGKPPYDLVIGNSPAVSATFRGAPVDVRAHAVNGVARFSLGDLQ
ncbi:MAG: RodZ domain-containing protein [Gammaproteobacteria bacterium]